MADRREAADTREVLQHVDFLNSLLLESRAVFPTLGADSIGQRMFRTAPYYQSRGFDAQIQLREPISAEFIQRHRQLGRWINENALIRLYGVLHYHGFFTKLASELPGYPEMDLLRRLRNTLTKTPLNYRPHDPDNVKLREVVIERFNLKDEDAQEEIPLPINKVIEPLIEGCRRYIVAWTEAHNQRMEPTRDLPSIK